MESIVLFKAKNLSDDFEAIQKMTLQIVKMGLYKAAASMERPTDYKLTPDKKSIEQKSLAFLTTYSKMNAAKSKNFRRKALTFMAQNEQSKKNVVGSLSKIKVSSTKPILEDAKQLGLLSDLKFSKGVSDLLKKNKTKLAKDFYDELLDSLGVNLHRTGGGNGAPPITGNTELRFNLISLKCLDPVDWELTDFGQDHINIGGMGADNLGQEVLVNQFFVREFEKNERHTYSPPKKFVGFKLNTPGDWPRAFDVTMALAEKDADGGFLAFLQELWGIIGDVVTELVTTAAITAIGAIAGTAIEPGIGTLIGAIVGAVVGYIVTSVFDSLNDDIFDPESQMIAVPSINSLFPGNSKVSDILSTEFTSKNARYLLKYQWQLV
jgi:hypothetical protein